MNNKMNHEIRTKVDKNLKDLISKRAKQCNMKECDYIRYILKNTNIRIIVEE